MLCVEACMLFIKFMIADSPFAKKYCRLCAEVCEWCAQQCQQHDHEHCQACAAACTKCAQECRVHMV
ncbi:four-helix bundle copper-binding protein [Tamlana haliotis]|uniref:Four-helix bundle copper-binding protein n=2 Tax=Pseudotamlana haliotis TaxID=2614804 RepID=A0A6N6MEI9_9FLAO|nr:four-helix bundle copper-binding protein [Tamlana haliotis]